MTPDATPPELLRAAHCSGTLLDRYTVLLREPLSAGERRAMELAACKHRALMKEFGRLMHEAEHSPNGRLSNGGTAT